MRRKKNERMRLKCVGRSVLQEVEWEGTNKKFKNRTM
jgi:hypothetical protein